MNYKFKTKPFEHQLDALKASYDKEVFAYFTALKEHGKYNQPKNSP